MEEDTLEHLLVAAANPDIAKKLSATDLLKELELLGRSPGLDPHVKHAAQRVIDRLRGWDQLLAAIWEPNASFAPARAVLRDLGGDEPSFGVVLHAFVTHPDLVARISETEELVELRAWVGVACVLAAYAWADSVPNELCRSRAFGVMRVWQSAPHYREVRLAIHLINHLVLTQWSQVLNFLLLLRQMIFRLECMMDDDTPTRSGIHAEHILYDLSRDPRAFLSPHLVKCLLQLQPGFSAINEAECTTLRTLARLADDGLTAAVHEISNPPTQPVSADDLLKLRVATVVLAHELSTGDSDEGEWAILNALWAQNSHGLPLHLLSTLEILTADVQAHFSLTIPPPLVGTSSLTDLLAAANELLLVLAHLIPTHPLPGRAAHGLINVVADLFASADAADMLASVDSTRVALSLRNTCVGVVRALEPELVLRALLRRGADIAGASAASQDPARRAQHALSLVDLILPLEADSPGADTARRALPRILPELAAFFRALDVDGRAHLVRRLAELDGGVLGLAEWLVLEELRALGGALRVLAAHDDTAHHHHDPTPALCALKAHQAVSALRLLHDLVRGTAPTAQRLLAFIAAEPEPAGLLAAAMNLLLATRAASLEQVELAQALVQSGTGTLSFVLALVFLRAVQHAASTTTTTSMLTLALTALRQVPIRSIEPDRLSTELGDTLVFIASASASTTPATITSEEAQAAPAVLALLEWLVDQSHAGLPQLATLHGISTDTFAQLCDELASALPSPRRAALEHVRMHLQTPHAEDAVPRPLVELPPPGTPVRLSLDALFRPPHYIQQQDEQQQEQQEEQDENAEIVDITPQRASTPVHARGVLNMVTVSPPTALLRSPAVTGLTRTYTANDFRALRQTPSARQNTSRLPSTHVDVRPLFVSLFFLLPDDCLVCRSFSRRWWRRRRRS